MSSVYSSFSALKGVSAVLGGWMVAAVFLVSLGLVGVGSGSRMPFEVHVVRRQSAPA